MFYNHVIRYIEDICFFEVNTKYISSSELKTLEFSRVRSTSENVYFFNPRDGFHCNNKKNLTFLLALKPRYTPAIPGLRRPAIQMTGV